MLSCWQASNSTQLPPGDRQSMVTEKCSKWFQQQLTLCLTDKRETTYLGKTFLVAKRFAMAHRVRFKVWSMRTHEFLNSLSFKNGTEPLPLG